jgi:hypothetical protein
MGRVSMLGLGLAALVAVGGGCAGGAGTPEEAYQRLAEAVGARDGGRLFDALDLETRWSWMSIQKAQRESYDIILSNYPEGAERQRLLRRCEDGALSADPRALFARQSSGGWGALAAGLPARGKPTVLSDTHAEATGADGRKLPFRRVAAKRRWGWGFAGLAEVAEQTKRRSMADLDLLRTSAADYERAATRQQVR